MSGLSQRRLLAITISTGLASLLQSLDSTIANVALPYMQASLSASQDEIGWVLTSYITAAAIATAPVGWLAQRFGLKQVLAASVVGFTAFSMLCGLAQTLPEEVLFRLLQGVCGAAFVPLCQAVLLGSYPPERVSSAMAWWAMGSMMGPVLGPTVGGWLTQNVDWRWIFFVNLPLGALAFIGIVYSVPDDTTRPAPARFDWLGFVFLGVTLGSLQLLLDRGTEKDWFDSSEIVAETALAALGFYLFMAHSLTTPRPFLSFRLFADRNFVGGLVLSCGAVGVMSSVMTLFPQFFETIAGYPVATVGWMMVPRSLGSITGFLIAPYFVRRFDARLICIVGISATTLGCWLTTGWTEDVFGWTVVYTFFLQGIGTASGFVAVSSLTFSTIPTALRTEGTIVFGLFRNCAQSLVLAITNVMLVRNAVISHASIAASVTPFNHPLTTGAAARVWNLHTEAGRAALNQVVTHQATTNAFLDDFKLEAFITALTFAAVFLIARPKGPVTLAHIDEL